MMRILCGIPYLSIEMQTSTKLDRYRPNVRKNDISRHIASPATHCTVNDQPISIGIVRNVTKRSARAKCISIASILDGLLTRRSISSFSTVKLHTADITIKTLSNHWNFHIGNQGEPNNPYTLAQKSSGDVHHWKPYPMEVRTKSYLCLPPTNGCSDGGP